MTRGPPVYVSVDISQLDTEDLADNYLLFGMFRGGNLPSETDRIGYNRGDTIKKLVHASTFDNGVAVSIHESDDSTDYKNTSGKTAYFIVTVNAGTNSGERSFKIWSGPTTDTTTGATQVFDLADVKSANGFFAISDKYTSYLVPISNNHFAILENTSGAASRELNVSSAIANLHAVVIEQS